MNIFNMHTIKIISLATLFILLNGCASGGGAPEYSGSHWDDDYYYRNGYYNSYYPVYVPGHPRPPAHIPDRPRPPARPPSVRPPIARPPRPRPRAR